VVHLHGLFSCTTQMTLIFFCDGFPEVSECFSPWMFSAGETAVATPFFFSQLVQKGLSSLTSDGFVYFLGFRLFYGWAMAIFFNRASRKSNHSLKVHRLLPMNNGFFSTFAYPVKPPEPCTAHFVWKGEPESAASPFFPLLAAVGRLGGHHQNGTPFFPGLYRSTRPVRCDKLGMFGFAPFSFYRFTSVFSGLS